MTDESYLTSIKCDRSSLELIFKAFIKPFKYFSSILAQIQEEKSIMSAKSKSHHEEVKRLDNISSIIAILM